MKTDWVPIVFEGSAAAVISAALAFAAAYWLSRRQSNLDTQRAKKQRENDRELARLERKLAAATSLVYMIGELRSVLLSASQTDVEECSKSQNSVTSRWPTLSGLGAVVSPEIGSQLSIFKVPSVPPLLAEQEVFDRVGVLEDLLVDALEMILKYIEHADVVEAS